MPLLSERQPLPEKLFFSLASGILMRKKMEAEFNAKPALKLIIKKKKKKIFAQFLSVVHRSHGQQWWQWFGRCPVCCDYCCSSGENDDYFNLFEDVDALYNDGWQVGVISKVFVCSKYLVYFRDMNEEMEF